MAAIQFTSTMTIADLDLGGIDAESDPRLAEYFVSTPYVRSVTSGRRTLFLGRKGSGKSSLFVQLDRIARDAGLSTAEVLQITPDQYAWAAMKTYQEQGLLSEQAHANAWKLTLAIEIAGRIVSLDREWSAESKAAVTTLKAFLSSNFGSLQTDLVTTATRLVRDLKSINLSAFGFGIGAEKTERSASMTPAVISSLFDRIRIVAMEVPFLIGLDRLDDSWDASSESRSLLVGLLKAAKELNDSFQADLGGGKGVRIIVFLRSDIYDSLTFDDKDKHRPTEENIVWSSSGLHEMLQRRLPERLTVEALFEPGNMRGSIAPFNYIVKRTFLRPREVLQFVYECLRDAGPGTDVVSKDNVRAAEGRYSRWKVADLKQEFSKVFPAFDQLLEALRQERQRFDSIEDLTALLERKLPDLAKQYGGRVLVETLLDASVIGVRVADTGPARYKSEDLELVLPSSGAVYVHQAVHRGLNIKETRRGSREEVMERRAQQAELSGRLVERMLKALPVQDLLWFGLSPKPIHVITHQDFDAFCHSFGLELVESNSVVPITNSLQKPNLIRPQRLVQDRIVYLTLRADVLQIFKDAGVAPSQFLKADERDV